MIKRLLAVALLATTFSHARPVFQSDELEASRRDCARYLTQLILEHSDDQVLQRKGREFAHTMLRQYSEEEGEFVSLRRAVIAARLHVSVDFLLSDPAFESFIVANHLDARLIHYDHAVIIDEAGEPQLLVQGQYTPFRHILEEIPTNEHGKLTGHQYLFQGIVPGSPAKSIKAFDVRVPAPGHHLIEIVRYHHCKPHTWVRLIAPGGRTFSFGLYGPCAIRGPKEVVKCLAPGKGRILSPDPAEFMADEVDLLFSQEISPDCFRNILQFARKAQSSEDLTYQILGTGGGDNCETFADRLLEQVTE